MFRSGLGNKYDILFINEIYYYLGSVIGDRGQKYKKILWWQNCC